jgi:uncharacterized protein YpmB
LIYNHFVDVNEGVFMAKEDNKHPLLLIICMVLAIIIGSIFIIFKEINRPMDHDRVVATQIAKQNTDLKKVDRVTRFVYNQVEYTVSGSKADGTGVFVVITKNGKQAAVYRQDAGVDERKAIAKVQKHSDLKKITSSRFGIIKDKPVWMISYLNQNDKLVIKTIDFKTGKEQKSVTTY